MNREIDYSRPSDIPHADASPKTTVGDERWAQPRS